MTRKVKLTDYNQRIEVPASCALFLEGGDIVINGEIGSEGDAVSIVDGKPGFAAGGGGGGFSPTITSPQEGDIIQRVGGVWVNSGNLKIGAEIEASSVDVVTTTLKTIPLDQPFGIYFMSGFVLNDAGDGLVVPVTARYLIGAELHFFPDVSNDLRIVATANVTNGEAATVFLPHTAPNESYTVAFTALLELTAGQEIHFQAGVRGANATMSDSYLRAQYVGPAVSI